MPGDNDTQAGATTTPNPNASTAPAGDATGAGSAAPDEVSLLKSRYAGQTAKVNELTAAQAALAAERDALKAQLDAAQRGTIDKDEALKAQLAAKDAEIAATRREAALARIEAKYPETFAVLGEDAANLSDVKLAENEARLRGAAEDSGEPPTPRGNNGPRTPGGQAGPAAKPKSSADLVAELKAGPKPDWMHG